MKSSKISFILLIAFSLFFISASNAALAVSWTVNYDSPVDYIRVLAVYNDRLYAGGATGQSNAHLFVYDGTTWNDLNFSTEVGVPIDLIEALQVFDNRLFIGCRVNISGTAYSRVYSFDGTTFSHDFSTAGISGYSGIDDFVIHNNILYAANGAVFKGQVFKRIGDNNWSSMGGLITPGGDPARSLASYKGSLYAGTGAGEGAKVWRWNGSGWDLNVNITELFGINQDGIQSLASNSDFLYAGTAGSIYPSVIPVYDGSSWTSSINVTGSVFLSVINNQIWAGTGDDQVFWNNGTWQDYGIVSHANDFVEYRGYIYAAGNDGNIYRTDSIEKFTISGQITDRNGNSIPDVKVCVSSSQCAVTDIHGNYIIGEIPAGAYIVTPEMSGFVFSPQFLEVNVQQNVDGQDFIGTFTNPSIGFTPSQNGYSFQNPRFSSLDFPKSDMRIMFGDELVCASVKNNVCEYTQTALDWYKKYKSLYLFDGICFGMTVTSLRLFKNIDSVPESDSVYNLSKNGVVRFTWKGQTKYINALRYISFFYMSQNTNQIHDLYLHGINYDSPNNVLEQLIKSMMSDPNNPRLLVIVNSSDTKAHSLTPYTITNPNPGIFYVWVYDPNHPYDPKNPIDSLRYVIFNRVENSWTYDKGPNNGGVWSGYGTPSMIVAIPLSIFDDPKNPLTMR